MDVFLEWVKTNPEDTLKIAASIGIFAWVSGGIGKLIAFRVRRHRMLAAINTEIKSMMGISGVVSDETIEDVKKIVLEDNNHRVYGAVAESIGVFHDLKSDIGILPEKCATEIMKYYIQERAVDRSLAAIFSKDFVELKPGQKKQLLESLPATLRDYRRAGRRAKSIIEITLQPPLGWRKEKRTARLRKRRRGLRKLRQKVNATK